MDTGVKAKGCAHLSDFGHVVRAGGVEDKKIRYTLFSHQKFNETHFGSENAYSKHIIHCINTYKHFHNNIHNIIM